MGEEAGTKSKKDVNTISDSGGAEACQKMGNGQIVSYLTMWFFFLSFFQALLHCKSGLLPMAGVGGGGE